MSTTLSAASLLPVVGAELEVETAGGSTRRYVNLDYAATAPALESVAAAVAAALPTYGSVHRGTGLPSRLSTARYEAARETVARFAGARPDDVVVFTRNTTDALNLLASCVPAGGEVAHLDLEHHANLLTWQGREAGTAAAAGASREPGAASGAGSPGVAGATALAGSRGASGAPAARCVAVAVSVRETLARLARALDERPAALVAITGASNVTGERLPVREVVALAHARGARVVVDAAQLAPHGEVDLAGWGADYVAFSGHKLYAPFGSGALVGRRDWLDAAAPYLPGGGAVREVSLDGTRWLQSPERHEGGTPNLLGAIALAAACDALAALEPGALEAHEAALRERLIEGLADLDGVSVVRIFTDAPGAVGIVAFTVAGHRPYAVAARLADHHGIGVRAGRFCAHPLLDRLGLPGGAVRASFGVGTTAEDVDRLLAALAE